MFWFEKHHPQALYMDCRRAEKGICKERPNFQIQPDLIADFRRLPFREGYFHLIVWDPPHLKQLGRSSILAKKYGILGPEWQTDLRTGFDELWRVLAPNGTLIFKWNEDQISLKEVLACFKEKPIFGHPTGKIGKTIWCAFFKVGPEL